MQGSQQMMPVHSRGQSEDPFEEDLSSLSLYERWTCTRFWMADQKSGHSGQTDCILRILCVIKVQQWAQDLLYELPCAYPTQRCAQISLVRC